MNNKPKLKIPLSATDRMIELITIVLLLFHIMYLISQYQILPNEVPVHFNAKGKVDAYGSKSSIWILPAINIGVYILLTIVQLFPHIHNYKVNITPQNAAFQYKNSIQLLRILKLIITIFLSYISFATIQVALHKKEGLTIWFLPVFLIAIFTTIGYYMVRSFRNNKA